MISSKLKTLIKTAAEIINIFLESNPADASSFSISPFYDSCEKGSEIVTVTFDSYQLDWDFLEPVAKKLMNTSISWNISKDDGKFQFNLYF